MNSTKQITVIGATGNLGAPVVKNLAGFRFNIKAIVRDVEKANRLFGDIPIVEIVEADLEDIDSLTKALKGTSYL